MTAWKRPKPKTRNKGSRDGWNTMPDQPKECSGCGKTMRISKDTMAFDRWPVARTLCTSCLPFTVLLSVCGCAYCEMALAAISDARDAHRKAA